MKISNFLIILILNIVGIISSANSCQPAAVGTIRQRAGTLNFCNGSGWNLMGDGISLGSCAAGDLGKIRFQGSVLQWCDANDWISLDTGSTGVACTTQGQQIYQSSMIQYCGTSSVWHETVTTSATLNFCPSNGTQMACENEPNCQWSFGVCSDCACNLDN